MDASQAATGRRETRKGLLFGAAAFLSWGFIALYFKAVGAVPPEEVLAHRIVWSAAFLLGFLAFRGRLGELAETLRDGRRLRVLGLSAGLILVNWYLFIWAIANARLVDASLGYYINPLVNVLLGRLFLRERLTAPQKAAVGLALLGVAHQVWAIGSVPVLGLVLATTFGLYGLVRKSVTVDAPVGLAAETLLVAPLAIAWMAWQAAGGDLAFLNVDRGTTLLLMAAGPVTALPLLWFVHAVRRLRYGTVGLLQYLAPTLQFATAVVAFGEPFDHHRLITFALIWAGLALYSWDALRRPVGAG